MRGRHLLQHAFLQRAGIAALTSLWLGGCGVLPMVAQQTTAAALAPFTNAAQQINTGLQLVGRGIAAATPRVVSQSQQLTTAINQTRVAAQPITYQAPSPMPYRAAQTSKASGKKDDPSASAELDILPAKLLARLTPDQKGLQRAAQNAATKAVVGETVFWHLDGREGSVVTESENNMGGFTCRTFTQRLALEDYFDYATVIACRTKGGVWTRSF